MDELGNEERARLYERFGRSYAAGEAIYAEGDPADLCFLVQEGRVRVFKRIRDAERSLTVLRTGDVFGEEALLAGAVRGAAAEAQTPVTALALDRRTFGMLLSGSPAVAARLIEQLVGRLRDAEEQLENAMLRDHPSRIVNTLLRLAAAGEATPEGVALRISPLELASRVGLDVDTVKRIVQQLRDGGHLAIVDERIVVPEIAALRRLYQLLGLKEEVRGG